jgi:threonine synthase
VGGGALAACVAAGLADVALPRLHAVQTASAAPLARAWHGAEHLDPADVPSHWAELMWPWEQVGESAADGILDDETYDWLPVLRAVRESNGSPVVVTEQHVHAAHEMVLEHTDVDASPTGTAGVAGVLAMRHELSEDERIAVVLSGVRR